MCIRDSKIYCIVVAQFFERIFCNKLASREIMLCSNWVLLPFNVESVVFASGFETLFSFCNNLRADAVSSDYRDFIRLHFRFTMQYLACLLYTSPSPRDGLLSRMPSSA